MNFEHRVIINVTHCVSYIENGTFKQRFYGASVMQLFYRLFGTTLTLWALVTTAAWAETRYISDQLVVSLRTSPQNGEIIKYLRTDNAVEVIEEVGDFIKVQTK